MSDPRRMSDETSIRLERDLLCAAQDDVPPAGAELRAAMALGLAAGVAAGATAPPPAVAAASEGAKIAGAKVAWSGAGVLGAKAIGIGVAATVAAVAVGSWMLASPSRALPTTSPVATPATPPRAEAPAAMSAPAVAAPAPAPVEATPPVADAPPKRSTRPPAPAAQAPSIGDELALLDRARAAFNGGDPGGALRLADEHDAKWVGGGTFALETSVLRIDALDALGRRALALEEAEGFLAAHPNEAMSRHVRLLADRIRNANATTNP